MPGEGLFTLVWPVDDHGYDLVFIEPEPLPKDFPHTVLSDADAREPYWALKPRGGPIREYWPLEDEQGRLRGLARQLSEVDVLPLAIQEFANEFGLLGFDRDGKVERISDWQRTIIAMRDVLKFRDDGKLEDACNVLHHSNTSWLRWSVRYERAKPLKLELSPITLAGALWFEVAGELTKGTTYRKCSICSTWWPVGPGAYTKRRITCSDKCRTALNRAAD